MLNIKISEEIKSCNKNLTLGCLKATVTVEETTSNLLNEINNYLNILSNEMNIEDIASHPQIAAGRETYKKLGKSPSKYRLSSEALIRRILQGKGLYKVNNIVDINNLISLKSKLPVGSYNLDNLTDPIILTVGNDGEEYKAIGKAALNIANLPVLTDSIGIFGSPTSDSERAMITYEANSILMIIYSFTGKEDIEKYLCETKGLLEKYAEGHNFELSVIN